MEHYFPLSSFRVESLPKVDILYGRPGPDIAIFHAAVDNGAKGMVLAGMGAGCWESRPGAEIAAYAKKHGFPVVASRRIAYGFVGSDEIYGPGHGCIGARHLNPAKCRITLQIPLACGPSVEAIALRFNKPQNKS